MWLSSLFCGPRVLSASARQLHPAPHELVCSQVQSTPAWPCTACSTSSSRLAIMCLKADRLCAVLLAKIAETLFFMLPIILMLSLKHSSRRYLLIASELLGSILCLSSFFLGLLHIEPHINGICSNFKIRAGRQSCVTDTHCGSLAVRWAQRGAEVGSWRFSPSPLPALQEDVGGGALLQPLLGRPCGRPFQACCIHCYDCLVLMQRGPPASSQPKFELSKVRPIAWAHRHHHDVAAAHSPVPLWF